jgi:hypothetical protein
MGTISPTNGHASEQQTRYWNEMVQLKVHIFYLSYHCRSADQRDFWLNCVTAVASSGSIAGWAIWESYGFVWGFVIAISQVIMAVKHLLPYAARKAATNNACKDLERQFIKAESDWYNVAEGMLTEEEIHRKTMAIKKGKLDTANKHLSAMVLPRKENYVCGAAKDAEDYFNALYFKENGDG